MMGFEGSSLLRKFDGESSWVEVASKFEVSKFEGSVGVRFLHGVLLWVVVRSKFGGEKGGLVFWKGF
jgi:hypothetical protein